MYRIVASDDLLDGGLFFFFFFFFIFNFSRGRADGNHESYMS